jgi:thymidylate synthase (FAD)
VSNDIEPEAASKGPESDERLIRYLMRNGHGSVFEHSVFRFFVKAPIFVAREWIRHRISSTNEVSGRYAILKNEFYVPDHVRVPHPTNKQQSVRDDSFPAEILELIEGASAASFREYEALLSMGVAREMARILLPVNTYTKWWWTINCRSLLNFLMLRNAPTAMWEIVQYAEVIEGMFVERMPVTHAAFVEAGRRAP